MNNVNLIVTRHAGLLEWVCRRLPGTAGFRWVPGSNSIREVLVDARLNEIVAYGMEIPVISHADVEAVRGKHVIGVLPLSLARHAASVTEVEMPLLRPDQRGKELTPAEMDAAGARLGTPLVVCPAPAPAPLPATVYLACYTSCSPCGTHGGSSVLAAFTTRDGAEEYLRLNPNPDTGWGCGEGIQEVALK